MSPFNQCFLLLPLKAQIMEVQGEEAKKNKLKENLCLKKPGLEECGDSLVNWDHLLNVNPS